MWCAFCWVPGHASLNVDTDYIGRVTRLGMDDGGGGNGLRNAGRCNKPAVSRVLDAGEWKDKLQEVGLEGRVVWV